jgi:hypothetical protein
MCRGPGSSSLFGLRDHAHGLLLCFSIWKAHFAVPSDDAPLWFTTAMRRRTPPPERMHRVRQRHEFARWPGVNRVQPYRPHEHVRVGERRIGSEATLMATFHAFGSNEYSLVSGTARRVVGAGAPITAAFSGRPLPPKAAGDDVLPGSSDATNLALLASDGCTSNAPRAVRRCRWLRLCGLR